MRPTAITIYPDPELLEEFEETIKSINQKAGRKAMIFHGDKKRYVEEALREWMSKRKALG